MASPSLRLGFGIPQVFVGGPVDPRLSLELAEEAEGAGMESLWVMDTGIRTGGASPALEPLGLLAHVAARTSRARLGVSVLVTASRSPLHLAATLATLDHLSGGRLVVGVGVGHPRRAPLHGLAVDGWTARFEEGIEVMLSLWRQGASSHHGRFWHFEDLDVQPDPLQRPHPPLWFGARARPALRRAARLGSGWMGAGSSSSSAFLAQRSLLLAALEEEGRDTSDFTISKRVYLAVDDDAGRAEQRVREWFGSHYGSAEMGSECAVWGPPGRCAEELARLRDAGAQLLVLNPMFDHRDQLERLVESVVPSL